jgi:hypothetical protein
MLLYGSYMNGTWLKWKHLLFLSTLSCFDPYGMATNKKEAITCWIFYIWFVLEFGMLANKIFMEAWCGGNVMEDSDKEL